MRARTSTHGPADRTQSALEHLLRVPQRARPGGTRGQRGEARKGAQKGLTTVNSTCRYHTFVIRRATTTSPLETIPPNPLARMNSRGERFDRPRARSPRTGSQRGIGHGEKSGLGTSRKMASPKKWPDSWRAHPLRSNSQRPEPSRTARGDRCAAPYRRTAPGGTQRRRRGR